LVTYGRIGGFSLWLRYRRYLRRKEDHSITLGTSPGLHGFAIASALYGTVLVRCLAAGPHWIFAALLTTFFPKMVSSLPPEYIFSFFTGMMCLQLLWVITMVPETKNIPLEELQKELAVG
jgi:hypothetical protein